ncbi:helix-turn-helix domain-containing protein [Weissella ceti]|uniref:Helix-turn-helix domain-containing protein n=1 Tax=Weissella ceti TaxID=759620 RepID=A0ABT3E4Y9_9LACO|nr:helix-turn-helix transcriptional regulator [Weissella ceti]MCW0953472.1 helix-turn-helix domain-containing protein [Weissella ceti]MCW0953483.1 helix-turn-helix domain-containing protein [Weissella ceti]
MSFEHDIKQLRSDKGMTQQQVADALHVSRQTVSTWERGKNYPSLDVLKSISELFDVSFEQLLFGGPLEMKKETKNVAQVIDKEVSLKGRYKKLTIVLGIIFALLIGSATTFYIGYEKGNDTIDRVNPFLPYQISYAKFPGDKEILKQSKKEDGRWSGWFSVNEMGTEWLKLNLYTGLNHGVKDPYVMVNHKGTFVKEAMIVPGAAIDKLKKNNADFIYNYLNTNKYEYVTAKERKELNDGIRIHDFGTGDFPGYMEPLKKLETK